MKRGDLAIAVVIALVTGLSWSVSLIHDESRVSADSFAAGRDWAQRTAAQPRHCQMKILGRTGPELDSMAWREGCRAQAEANATARPAQPSGAPTTPAPPTGDPPASADAPAPGLPAPK